VGSRKPIVAGVARERATPRLAAGLVIKPTGRLLRCISLHLTQTGSRVCIAAVYWITSSAVANSVSGMVRPSALAVLRLMTRSNLVGCSTGRSAGFSPFRMRPV